MCTSLLNNPNKIMLSRKKKNSLLIESRDSAGRPVGRGGAAKANETMSLVDQMQSGRPAAPAKPQRPAKRTN